MLAYCVFRRLIVGVHTLSLLLSSQVAHGRATEDNHTQIDRVSYTRIK